ncbi:radical SAM protein, partial [bacterium]
MLSPRPYLIEEYTQTVCPGCFENGPRRSDEDVWRAGMLVSHDEKVWMRRFCAEHGETESLYEEDLQLWRARAGWSTPTSQIIPDRPDNYAPFPAGYRNGLPAYHGQHTCILLLNVTKRCNFACPTCYASAQRPGTPLPVIEHPTIEEITHTVEVMLEREGGKLGVLMLSGGEPTVREDLPEIIERSLQGNVVRVLINTNGRRIARDDRFLEFLKKNRDRVEIYLQFDGFKASTSIFHRGEDVVDEKLRALKRLNDAGIWSTLVMSVSRGINDDEVGAVIKLGMDTPYCSGAAIQPVFGSGRNAGFDPQDRATPTGIARRLGAQTGGLISGEDFIP